jgi:hypothetical protein
MDATLERLIGHPGHIGAVGLDVGQVLDLEDPSALGWIAVIEQHQDAAHALIAGTDVGADLKLFEVVDVFA